MLKCIHSPHCQACANIACPAWQLPRALRRILCNAPAATDSLLVMGLDKLLANAFVATCHVHMCRNALLNFPEKYNTPDLGGFLGGGLRQVGKGNHHESVRLM